MDRDKIQIANPCSEDFDEMGGEGAKRFCDSCDKHVHNLSDMTRAEALELIRNNKDSGICVVYLFDESNRVRFRDDLNFRRPSKGQLRGVKKLLAAAAMIPVLATLPACDPAPYEEPAAIEQPCDLEGQSTFKPLDEIIEAEQAFVNKFRAFLGFGPDEGPEVEMLAGAPAVDPQLYQPEPQPYVEPVEPEQMIMGEMAPPDWEPEPEPQPEPVKQKALEPEPERMIMGDMMVPEDFDTVIH